MSLIKDLKPYKDEWRLTVKLLHSWKQSTSFGGDTLECVLVDESGDKIQASCKKSLMVRLQRYLPVGEWMVTDTFKIGGAGGQYRPTKQQYKMTILSDTMISHVMGQVTDLAAVATCQVKGIDTKRVNFRLHDASGSEVACCLWGKYAEQIEKHIEETTAAIEICLISFAKIKEYRALFDQNNEKKMMTKVKDDWDVVDVRCISELLLGVEPTSHKFKIVITANSIVTKLPVITCEVPLIDHNIESSSEDVSTSCSKRKEGDADLSDMNSTSKKSCSKKLIFKKTEED
ncbi:hypothetical protein Bca101_010125 [Brassica carinata]